MTSETDKAALKALVIKATSAFLERDKAQKAFEAAQVTQAACAAQIQNVKVAFALFGIDIDAPDNAAWPTVRDMIGSVAYDEAINEGFIASGFAPPHVPPPPQPVEDSSFSIDEPLPDIFDAVHETFTSESTRPAVRVLVLEQLKLAAARGTKARAIREFIENTYGGKLHEKTVGMTLYRLSQEGLARREGQTWFFVPPKAETKNPAVGAAGSKASQ